VSVLEFNLLPEEFRRPEKVVRLRVWVVLLAVMAVLLAAFLAILYSGQTSRLKELSTKIEETQSEMARLQESVRLTEEVDRLKTGLEQNINAINALANQNAERVRIMQQINTCVPGEMSLVSLEEKSQTFLLTGFAGSNLIVAQFMDRLKASGKFRSVDLTFIKPATLNDEDVLSFEVRCLPNSLISAGEGS
jgi:Tfp pilus assembly protein PilN